MAEHEKCDLVIEHQAKIGGITKGMEILERQATTLFSKMDTAIDKINLAQAKIEKVQDTIENGIRADIKELCELHKTQTAKIDTVHKEGLIKAEEVKKESFKELEDIRSRLKPLEESSWIPALMNVGVKRAFLYFFAILLMMALANTAFWGVGKNYFFKETPGTMQSLSTTHYHKHTLSDGRVLLHAGNQLEPAFVIDVETKTLIPSPHFRTEESVKSAIK